LCLPGNQDAAARDTMKISKIVTLVLIIFAIYPMLLFAQGRDRMPGSERDAYLKNLNLTDEQYNAIKRMKAAHVKKILQLKSDVVAKHHEFRSLIGDPSVSEESIRSKGREIEAVNGQIMREMIDYELLVRKILTPEQIRLWSNVENAPPIRKSSGR
jgi:Spy/CpxP family protein refolding chaperone